MQKFKTILESKEVEAELGLPNLEGIEFQQGESSWLLPI